MDLFKFVNPSHPLRMAEGVLIQRTNTKSWIERYRDASSVEIEADASTGIREFLPIGSFVGNVDSPEIMIIEDHEITEDEGVPPSVKVTGRAFESFFGNRVVGSNHTFPSTGGLTDYSIVAHHTWDQAVTLLEHHLLADHLTNGADALLYLEIISTASGAGEELARIVKRGSLYSALLDLLAVDNLGVKTVRPGPSSPAIAPENMAVVIHRGVDRSSTIFSYNAGDIAQADYLWSNQKKKDCVYVFGKWVDVLIDSGESGISRRMMYVDASDIDQAQPEAPTGLARTLIVAAMTSRGKEALAKQKDIALTKADVNKDAQIAIFRKDYDVGDIVTVSGDYNETTTMRVSEHIEIEDGSGVHGYPTLTAL